MKYYLGELQTSKELWIIVSRGTFCMRKDINQKVQEGGARTLNQYATDEICRPSNSWQGFVRRSDTSVRTEGHRFEDSHYNIFRLTSCQTLIMCTAYARTEYELKALCGKVLRTFE